MGYESWIERTMIIERGCGVLLYSVVLFLVYSSLKKAKDYSSVRKTLNIYIIILSIMAFFYIPYKSADLYRWIEMTENWYLLSFGEFFETRIMNSATPMAELMIYLCRITRVDGALPAFCAFVFYNNVFYILKDQYKSHSSSSANLAIALLTIMSTTCFLEVISGVRCLVALSITARCFYDEMYNDKSVVKNIPFVLIACLIHSMATVILAIRLVFILVQKSGSFWKRVLNTIIVFAFCLFFLRYGSSYIEFAFKKADSYISRAEYVSYVKWGYLIGLITVIEIACVLSVFIKEKSFNKKNLFLFNLLLLGVELCFVFEFNIFHRATMFSSILILPLICQMDFSQKRFDGGINVLVLLSFIMLLISCTRGDLSAYKFFLL